MFRGRSAHVLDAKGRLSIPARFRDVLKAGYDNKLIVTNLPSCLAAYPFEEWRKIEEQFAAYSFGPAHIISFKRYFLGAAVECPVDAQGRILIPAVLRKEAGLNREVVLSGMLNFFEIWSKERLDEELASTRDKFEQISTDIFAEMGAGG